jgi:CubicO group peptidase (beta-lactamase class C family)
VHASLPDWARFVALHLKHTPPSGTPLLSGAIIDQLHDAAADEYAFGWGVVERDWARGKALTHAGSNTWWYAVVWMAPKRDLAFLAATNYGGDGAAKACDDAVVAMFEFVSKTQ